MKEVLNRFRIREPRSVMMVVLTVSNGYIINHLETVESSLVMSRLGGSRCFGSKCYMHIFVFSLLVER